MSIVEEVLEITLRSLAVSGTATLLASTWSVPLAYILAKPGRLRGLIASILEALVGIPTVLLGLALYMLFSRSGVLGFLHLLYTAKAIVVGQAILVTPLITVTACRVLKSARESFEEMALALGADDLQAMAIALRESLPGVASSVVMGFSRAVGELGIALMLGGNIRGATRVLTTAIALSVSMGEYDLALYLGAILVAISVLVSVTVKLLEEVQGP
ncbi:MAG: ABC transporter substrate-binding protein [Thermoprotei archaeon]|nr:ABC transporter permease [Thermoproteales archaeon]RLE94594.1 MAG: ABC transporter substrate-binding protein [Thermoprotei archaeon]